MPGVEATRGRLVAAAAINSQTNLLRFRLDHRLLGFEPGQYIEVLDTDGTGVPFSIASIPGDLPHIDLHYTPVAGHPDVPRMARILAASEIRFTAPSGNCWLDPTLRQRPLLLAAAGTGISQALSLLRSLVLQPTSPSVELYWGVRDAAQLYLRTELDDLARVHPWFCWHAVVSDEPGYHGRRGYLNAVLTQDAAALTHRVTVLSGGPAAVYAMYDALLAAGAPATNFHADVFDYAPRP